MSESPTKFKNLLTKALRRIFAETDRPILEVQNDIGNSIGKTGFYVEHLRKGEGHVPTNWQDLVGLAQKLVDFGGLLSREEVEKFLSYGGYPSPLALSEKIFPQHQSVNSNRLYQRSYMITKRQISPNGLITSFCQVEIQSITDIPLSSVRHRRILYVGEREDLDFEFIPGTRDYGGTIRQRILHQDSRLFSWLAEFDPPLLKNQKASYSYTHTCRGVHAFTYEESHSRFLAKLKSKDFEYWQLIMPAYTHHLRMSLEFPPNYPISAPSGGWFNILSGSSEHLEEKARLTANKSFSATLDEKSNKWTLELAVQSAREGLTYELRWIPPRAASISH